MTVGVPFPIDGVLVIDKPVGPTSHDCVARARRALGTRRIGHTGTLDPLATGVLPLVVGRATRLATFLVSADKEYIATVRFGATTPTYDAEGHRAAPAAATVSVAFERLQQILERFRGTYLQMPPPFSAKKVDGIPAYRLARSEKPVPLTPVEVTVRALDLLWCEAGAARLRIVCSSGFYVRTLAHDIGQAAGCGAFLEELRRTRAGEFSLDAAVPLAHLEADPAAAAALSVGLERLLPDLPAAILTQRGAKRAAHGNSLRPEDLASASSWPSELAAGGPVRLLDGARRLLGIATAGADGLLHPSVVLV